MAETTNPNEPDILDQLTQENDPATPTGVGPNPENQGVGPQDDPNNPPENDDEPAVESAQLAEGVEVVDDMGNYNTRGPF